VLLSDTTLAAVQPKAHNCLGRPTIVDHVSTQGGAHIARPARAAPPQQRGPGPDTPAQSPCSPLGTPRAARRRSARPQSQALARSCHARPGSGAPAGGCAAGSGVRTTVVGRKSKTLSAATEGVRCAGPSACTRSGRRSSTGSSCAAAYGSSSAGRASPFSRSPGVGTSRCAMQTRSASCRAPHNGSQVGAPQPRKSSCVSRAASGCHCGRDVANTSAAHPALFVQGGVGRVRRHEQLGQRREQRLGSRRSRLDGARRHQHHRRMNHRLRADGCIDGRAALAPSPRCMCGRACSCEVQHSAPELMDRGYERASRASSSAGVVRDRRSDTPRASATRLSAASIAARASGRMPWRRPPLLYRSGSITCASNKLHCPLPPVCVLGRRTGSYH
jgi:hypothetical protein